MTNRLELNWKLDGFIDEQRYYCSETPIDPENLPVPKAVLAGDVRSYVDTDIEVGKTYFIRVGSVRNSIEKLSDEVKVIASQFKTNLRFDNNLIVDDGTDIAEWQKIGNVIIENEMANFASNSHLKNTNAGVLDFGLKNFSIELLLKPIDIGGEYRILLSGETISNWTAASQMFIQKVGGNSRFGVAFDTTLGTYILMTLDSSVTYNEENKVKLQRDANKLKIYVNDVFQNELTIPETLEITFNRSGIRIGSASWAATSFYTGSIKYLRALTI